MRHLDGIAERLAGSVMERPYNVKARARVRETLLQSLEDVRRQALEDAAQIADNLDFDQYGMAGEVVAERIRAAALNGTAN